jgi:hypothetical protein
MRKTNLVRPSRDGDQFHYLWAARRCLQLLSAQSGLVALSIEGPSPAELSGSSTAIGGEELIDIAEYFESEDIARARLVRYMQLKHSTLRAAEPWTAGGLQKTIEGFAQRYQDLLKTFSAEELANKVQFLFVTNRPIGADFSEAVVDAANAVAARHPKELEKLERFTKLNGDALAAFCKLLHFEDRQDNYWDQRNILFQDVSGYLPDADVDAPTQLKELVTKKALSESEQNPTITKMDVLRALKADERSLYPAECLLKTIDNEITREQEADLIRQIVEAKGQPVIVHASAGVGKSIFATRIGRGLPAGSISVLYDCFGNGQYRSATGYRHRPKDALVQIANELAARGLCHPLIPTPHADASAYLRAFLYRLGQAVTFLRLANPNALLCIIVDAADNAQMAAEEIGESRSFVRDLLREKMPDGVRLVGLCRSHRRADLDPPAGTLSLELRPFSRAETAVYLRHNFPDASEHDVDEFHRLSSENPRVQALALSQNLTLPETLRLLGPNPTTVETTIGNLLDAAIAKLRDSVGPVEKSQVDKICAGLAALRPLIPIPILSAMSGVQEEAIKSFAIDIGRPLLVTGDTIQFLDEPVETWFREKFKPSAAAMADFIAILKPLAAKSAYVSSALPQLMLEAGQFSELVELALTSGALPETSPLERRDVELQRLQFALKASLRSRRLLDAAKLALKAGGETAGDDRQRKLLQANTDLAAVFMETELIQEIVSRRTFGSGWLGSHHAYEAALLSGCKELVGDARSRLRMATEWLDNWSRLSADGKEEPISDDDIVELTLAHLNIHGATNGADSLRGWTPREVSFRIGRTVARRLIDHGRFQELDDFARGAGNNLCLVLAITLELREVQRTLPLETIRRAFRLVANTRIRLKGSESWDRREDALSAITALVEAALANSLCTHQDAAGVLSRYLPNEPPRGLASRFTSSRFPLLRAYCLRAALQGQTLQLIDLAHKELKAELEKKNRHSTSRDVQEFQEDIGALLPWHQLWAATFIGAVNKATFQEQIRRTQEASAKTAQIHYRDDFYTSNEIALLWFDILRRLDATDAPALNSFTQWQERLKRPLSTPALTSLARLAAQKEATKAAALDFASQAFAITKEERSDAEAKSNGYVDVARAVLSISQSDAEAYFNEAVEVASKIGDENLARWDAILDLADRAVRPDRPSPATAYQFARCAELTYDYVVRDKHFNWNSTVEALCGLCPSSSLAIMSRWRDRGFGWSERLLPVAVACLIERNSIDARDALPLICFHAQWRHDKLLDSVLAKCDTREEREATSAFLYKYLRWEGDVASGWKRLKEVTAKYGLTLPDLDAQIAFCEREERASKELQKEYDEEHIEKLEEPKRNWDEVFAGSNLTLVDGVARAYAAFKQTEPPWNHDQFFAEAFRLVPVGSEPSFIEAVGDTPEFDLFHFRNFLEQLPEAWRARLSVQHALATTLKAFCRRYCMGITKSRYYEIFPFEMACTLAGVSEADAVGVVLDAIGESSDLIESGRLFSLVGLLTSRLSHDEALEGLTFGLNLFDPALEEKDGDGQWSNDLMPPTEIKASIAGYIWAALAAPEAVLRWEAAHVVLGLCTLRRQDVIGHLAKFAAKRSGGSFVDAKLPFYELHAFQWLLIGFARAATETPAALAPLASQLVDWALKDQPHVMIRSFAARAALALLTKGLLSGEDKLHDRLSQVNVSPLPVVESKTCERVAHKKKEETADDDDRFYFGLDIGPYWCSPLGRVFALSQSDVETEALKVIRNDFGYNGKGRWDEDERGRRKLYAEDHTYHSHGSHPRADTLHFYHA